MGRHPGSPTVKVTRNDRYKLWQSMRVQQTFTTAELVATSGTGIHNAQRYVRALRGAGFLRVARPHRSGLPGGDAVYRLIRNTGPKPPRVRAGGAVFDPNTGAVYEKGNDR